MAATVGSRVCGNPVRAAREFLDVPSWFLGHEEGMVSPGRTPVHNPFHGTVVDLAENLL